MSRGPDFIVIGAMKSATTTLHSQLSRQPGFFMSTPKEPNFFSDDAIYKKGLDWYFSLFSDAEPTDLCGESSTHYTKLPTYCETITRMRSALANVKIVYMIRHPIDRLVSQYIHESIQGPMRLPIELAIDRYPRLVDYSRYNMQIEPYFNTYGEENVLIAFAERLSRRSQQELERICGFLGKSEGIQWDEAVGIQNARDQRLRPSKLRNMLVNAPVLNQIRRRCVPKSWSERAKSLWRVNRQPKIDLPEALTRRLKQVFDADLARLGNRLGIELSCDSYRDVVLGLQREPSDGKEFPAFRTK